MSNLTSKPHASRYPWRAWFEKGTFDLRKGTDYLCGTGTMASNARNRASKLGLSVSVITWKNEDGLTITVRSIRRAENKEQAGVPAKAPVETSRVPRVRSGGQRRAGAARS